LSFDTLFNKSHFCQMTGGQVQAHINYPLGLFALAHYMKSIIYCLVESDCILDMLIHMKFVLFD